jgi:uncharacterized protein YjbJ (UPF0337 family)
MSLEEKAKAAVKNVEGKIEEGAGFVAGVHEAEEKGRAKQAEAKVRQAKVEAEEAEDSAAESKG